MIVKVKKTIPLNVVLNLISKFSFYGTNGKIINLLLMKFTEI